MAVNGLRIPIWRSLTHYHSGSSSSQSLRNWKFNRCLTRNFLFSRNASTVVNPSIAGDSGGNDSSLLDITIQSIRSSTDVEAAAKSLTDTVPPKFVGHLFSDAAPVVAAGDLLRQIHGLPGKFSTVLSCEGFNL